MEGVEDVAQLAAYVRGHEATDAEIKLLCKDLQVLGRSEFKQLLRWRLLVKKDLQRQQAAAKEAAKEEGGGEEGAEGGSGSEGEEEDPEEKLLREMGEVKDRCVCAPPCAGLGMHCMAQPRCTPRAVLWCNALAVQRGHPADSLASVLLLLPADARCRLYCAAMLCPLQDGQEAQEGSAAAARAEDQVARASGAAGTGGGAG